MMRPTGADTVAARGHECCHPFSLSRQQLALPVISAPGAKAVHFHSAR